MRISWPLTNVKGTLEIDLDEKVLKISMTSNQTEGWFFDLNVAKTAKLHLKDITAKELDCHFEEMTYGLKAVKGFFCKPENNIVFRLKSESNSIVFDFSKTNNNIFLIE